MNRKLFFIFLLICLTACTSTLIVDFSPQAEGNFDYEQYGTILITINQNNKIEEVLLNHIKDYLERELFKVSISRNPQLQNKNQIIKFAKKIRADAVIDLKNLKINSHGYIISLEIEIYDPYGAVLIAGSFLDIQNPLPPKTVVFKLFNEIFMNNQNAIDRKEKREFLMIK